MTTEDHHAREDTAWFPVFITEFAVIVVINAITITAFARIRHLRKRSTYLIINLTVADLLVGAITGPFLLYRKKETKKGEGNHVFEWKIFLGIAFFNTFPVASQVNLCLISLDRLHATLFPFRHCLIGKWFYFKVIIISWFIAILLASLMAGLDFHESHGFLYAWASFSIFTVIFLAVSYIVIFLDVQKTPHSQHHSLIHTERKLSVTLFIVTGLSILTILPWAIYISIPVDKRSELSSMSSVDIFKVLAVLSISSSIVNPLVYVVRMQEFRKAIGNIVYKTTEPASRGYPLGPHSMP